MSPLCASLDALPKQGFELIAAGPGLSDEFSRELAGACADAGLAFGLVNEQHLDLERALNQALARSRGEIVCLLPGHGRLAPGLGRVLLGLYADQAKPGLMGRCLPWAREDKVSRLAQAEAEFYGLTPQTCFAARRALALQAGSLEELPRRLADQGRELPNHEELQVREPMPQGWSALWRRQVSLGKRVRDLKLQQLLILVFIMLLITFMPHDPQRALSLAAVCLLLLYPLNRPFLRHLGQNHPELLNTGLLFCLLRPFVRLAGGLAGALGRFKG